MENFPVDPEFLTDSRRTESAGGTDLTIALPKHQNADRINSKHIYFAIYSFSICKILFQLKNIPLLIM